ncbi:hypothetical protein C8Q76DRAFT_798062 [Earliella scabrosa]|nr:hypothetical protein C8Q76DRAFT_798062 [Earliella scabrosa]
MNVFPNAQPIFSAAHVELTGTRVGEGHVYVLQCAPITYVLTVVPIPGPDGDPEGSTHVVILRDHVELKLDQPNATVHVNDTTHRGPDNEGFHFSIKFPGYDTYWGFVEAYSDAMSKYSEYELDVCGTVAEYISEEFDPSGAAGGALNQQQHRRPMCVHVIDTGPSPPHEYDINSALLHRPSASCTDRRALLPPSILFAHKIYARTDEFVWKQNTAFDFIGIWYVALPFPSSHPPLPIFRLVPRCRYIDLAPHPRTEKHSFARIPLRRINRECLRTNTGIRFHAELLKDIGLDPITLWLHVRVGVEFGPRLTHAQQIPPLPPSPCIPASR